MYTIPQFHHTFDTFFRGGIQVRLYHDGIFTVIYFAVHHGVAVILHVRIGRECFINGFIFTEIGQLCFIVLSVNMLDRFMKLVGKRDIW